MTSWEYLHLRTHQVHRPHEQLREAKLLQHALIRQHLIVVEHLRIDRQHQQAVLVRQIQVMIHHGDVL